MGQGSGSSPDFPFSFHFISFHSSLKDCLEFDLAGKVPLRSMYRNQG